MIAKMTLALLMGASLVGFAGRARASEPLDMYDTEAAARAHCRNDAVVWLDVPSHRFFAKGQRGYAGAKTGGYTCKKDAVHSGNKPAAK
jgi:type IV secretory pathway protease TraF